ncbi:MAG: 3-oxoacyl-[acyl-carrier-protein] synthase III C-terminal domain-containing protein, partial [Phototrophicaceae bacterium]
MFTPLNIQIAGLGRYLPERIVPNSVLEAMCGLPDGWVAQYTGVQARRWVSGETASFMGAQAACQAADHAGIDIHDIDLIINASGTAEQAVPDGGALLQRALGLQSSGIAGFTVHATCLSFIMGLKVAAAMIASGQCARALIVSTEITSCAVNIAEPESAALFGDGAAAAIITATPHGEGSSLTAMNFETYSNGVELTQITGGGSRRHPNRPDADPTDNLFHMDGLNVLRQARQLTPAFLERLRPGLSTGMAGIDWVVPHQASIMGMRLMKFLGWDMQRVVMTLDRLGNCVSASIPLTLVEAVQDGRIQRGDEVLLVGTGAGLSL